MSFIIFKLFQFMIFKFYLHTIEELMNMSCWNDELDECTAESSLNSLIKVFKETLSASKQTSEFKFSTDLSALQFEKNLFSPHFKITHGCLFS